MISPKMAICLWFDDQAEEAANYYCNIFENAHIGKISRFSSAGFEHHQKEEGSVMTIEFNIQGMDFLGLNGGKYFTFNEASSIVVYCESQEEIDYLWVKLTDGGQEQPCGWLKDRFGVSWQIVPGILDEFLTSDDLSIRERVTNAVFKMKKPVIDEILKAGNQV